VDAWAIDIASKPRSCIDYWDFITTNCQLTWQGITVYGTVDAGFGWNSHGAPLDPRSAPGGSYLVQKYSRTSRWDVAPNGLSNSSIGIKGTEPVGGNVSLVFIDL